MERHIPQKRFNDTNYKQIKKVRCDMENNILLNEEIFDINNIKEKIKLLNEIHFFKSKPTFVNVPFRNPTIDDPIEELIFQRTILKENDNKMKKIFEINNLKYKFKENIKESEYKNDLEVEINIYSSNNEIEKQLTYLKNIEKKYDNDIIEMEIFNLLIKMGKMVVVKYLHKK